MICARPLLRAMAALLICPAFGCSDDLQQDDGLVDMVDHDAAGDGEMDVSTDAGSDRSADDIAADAAAEATVDAQSDLPPPPPTAWARRFGAADDDYAHEVAVDSAGNIAVAGFFKGTIDLGTGPLTALGDEYDIFIACYDPAGTPRWAKRFGGTGAEGAQGVAFDGSGNVLVTGFFQGTTNLGVPLGSAGEGDAFIASYDSAGNVRWAKRIGGTESDSGRGVAGDSAGNVAVTGRFAGSVTFPGVGTFTSAGQADVFLARYDASGDLVDAQDFGGVEWDYGRDVVIDGSGNISVTGYFRQTVDFGDGPLTSAGSDDIFLASYAADGSPRWSHGFGGAGLDQGWRIAVDGSGNLAITGRFLNTVNFGAGTLTSAGGLDAYVASFDRDGGLRWARRLGGGGSDMGTGVAFDDAGNVAVAGYFGQTVDFGTGPLTSAGGLDAFVASYDPAGDPRWAWRLGGSSADLGHGVAVDGSGKVSVTGYFQETVDFGAGPLTSAGGYDGFLLLLDPTL